MTVAAAEYCAYCGLPVPASLVGAQAAPDGPDYCCSGCRVAAAVEDAPAAEGAARRLLMRIGLAIFFTMNVVVFTMELWSQDVYSDPSFDTSFASRLRGVFQWASLLFAAPVLLLLAGPLAANVWQSLRRRNITTDLLILLGVIASYLYSAISVIRGEGQIYFEVGCVVLVFVSIGRWLEARGKHRTGAALDALARMLPDEVRRAIDGDEQALGASRPTETVPRAELVVGDLVRVLPGERLPVDGRIAAGRATLDEQIVTGESRPAAKGVGDAVYSGVLNVDGDLWIKATAVAGDDMVSRMLRMVREARGAKGRHEQLADRVAAWFVPAVCLIALAAAWRHAQLHGADAGILTGLAVVLIACPCALGLATPMAVWTALGRAASQQVLFRSGVVLERLAAVDVVCFDKTGTLTSGSPSVEHVLVADEDARDDVIARAAQLAAGSNHHLSRAIAALAAPLAVRQSLLNAAAVHTEAGRGVLAVDREGRTVAHLGSLRWMHELGQSLPESLVAHLAGEDMHQAPLACIAWDGAVRGAFVFREQVRPEAAAAVAACRDLGLELLVLTGDHRARAACVARELGVEAVPEQLPGDKVDALRRLGKRTAMVGDGINDAPALAAADVGVALGCGADLSRDAAGVCLLSDRLDRLPWAVSLARETVRVVRQNLFWAFAYNGVGIVLAATGRLNPIWAAAAMGASSVMVIANSLRLARYDAPLEASDAAVEPATTQVQSPLRVDNQLPPAAPSVRRHAATAGAAP